MLPENPTSWGTHCVNSFRALQGVSVTLGAPALDLQLGMLQECLTEAAGPYIS